MIEVPGSVWRDLCSAMSARKLLSPKEVGIMNTAAQLPGKVPSGKQCIILVELLEKARQEGLLQTQSD